MNLTLWKHRNPFNGELHRLRDEMDRTIDRLLGGAFSEPKGFRLEGWMPLVDVCETDSEITIRAEVPGIPAKDLDISVVGGSLILSGTKKEEEERKGDDWFQCERRFGAFRRSVELPESADPDRVTAESDAGVITIHVGKRVGVKPRHIEIRSGNGRKPVAL
jgi:HSP20 family protein